MAGATGLEPATSGVTGQRCNQLYYAPAVVRLCSKGEWLAQVLRAKNIAPEFSEFSTIPESQQKAHSKQAELQSLGQLAFPGGRCRL